MRHTDARIVACAIESIEDLGRDAASREQLFELLETGDATIAAAAATALGRAGIADALPALEHVARTGAEAPRAAAVAAIAELGGADAIALLGRLLDAGDKATGRAAADALISTAEDEGRALLVAAATKPGPARMIALQALRDARGLEVETLMLDIARTGTSDERRVAFQALVDAGSSAGFDVVVAAARSGVDGPWPVSLIAMGPSEAARSWIQGQPGDLRLHLHEPQLAVVEHEDLDRPLEPHRGDQILHRHPEATVADEGPHLTAGIERRGAHRDRIARPQRAVIERADHPPPAPQAHVPRDPHRALADVDPEDRVAGRPVADRLREELRVQRLVGA
jgi:hypothetical protein